MARSKRQDQILEVVTPMFAARGFHRVGMAEICQELGMSPGSFYRYFDSKNQLILAVVRDHEKRFTEIWKRIRYAPEVRPALIQALAECMSQRSSKQMALLRLEVMTEAARSAQAGELVRHFQEQSVEAAVQALEAAKADGDIAQAVGARGVAELLVQLSMGLPGTSRFGPPLGPRPLERMLTEVVYGLLPSPPPPDPALHDRFGDPDPSGRMNRWTSRMPPASPY